MKKRVVITGLGCITPIGNSVAQLWDSITNGRTGIEQLTCLPLDKLKINIGAEVKDYNPDDLFTPDDQMMMDRVGMFALSAADEAIIDAGLDFDQESRDRCAVIIGSAVGGKMTDDAAYKRLYEKGKRLVHPTSIPRIMLSAPPSLISMRYGLTGTAYAICSACASGAHAIGDSLRLIREGQADIALAGGTEGPFAFGLFKAWEALRVLSKTPCSPFSADRSGMNLGEGAAVLVLEELEHAIARGAHIYAEIAGYGATADAHHMTLPHIEGPCSAMRNALEDAGLERSEINYINAHGTGTKANDQLETEAIKAAFEGHARKLGVSATKSMHGHALGATSAIEALISVKAVQTDTMPPTINYREVDSACDLDYVTNSARETPIEAALSNAFAFGGLNAVLAFSKYR